ncbi:MAG: hypothetical protein HC837_13285 [Chloroflexaceae bacterium]|nr:hypothetical protein [Chloroflexaceae bacterium]
MKQWIRVLVAGLLVLLVVLAALPSQQPVSLAVSTDSVFGVNSHIGSRHGDFTKIQEPVELLTQSGATWVREEFQWGLIDESRAGVYHPGWTVMDTVIPALTEQGINVIGLLNDAPFHPPNDLDGFVAFVRDAVERYPQVTHWEVWNEPENKLYWPNPNPAEYTRVLKVVSQAIKEENPNAKVLMAGIVPTHIDFLRGIAENGGWDAIDIIALHPYVDPFTPETGQIGYGGDISKLRTVIEQYGAKPIWATEFGWSTGPADRLAQGGDPVDPETQANYLVRGAVMLSVAGIERIIWYKFKDDGPTNQYGMFGTASGPTDFSDPKPAYFAFSHLNKRLAGTVPVGPLQIGRSEVVLDFEAGMPWTAGPTPPKGSLTVATEQHHSGNMSGRLNYQFNTSHNDWVGFTPENEIPIPGSHSRIGVWVYGDGKGHELWAWLRDANGEELKFRLGIVGPGDRWRFLSTPINGTVQRWQWIERSQPGNLQLEFPVTLTALALDDNPDTERGSGTFYIDDLVAMSPAQGVRFKQGDNNVVDVIWSTGATQQVAIPSESGTGTLYSRDGSSQTVTAQGNVFLINASESPVYLEHDGGPMEEPRPTPRAGSNSTPTPRAGSNSTPTPRAGSNSTPTPTREPPGGTVQLPPPCQYFPETDYEVCGRLLEYWQQNGALAVFGYPVTPSQYETIEGQQYVVQWFQRNRMELHPENNPPYDVLLGRLGAEAYNDRTAFGSNQLPGTCYRITGAQHDVCGAFLNAWRADGLDLNLNGISGENESENLALFGLPLTEPRTEVLEGREYLVQWFERARFEYHPENEPPFDVLFGLLGNEVLGNP